MYLKTFRSFSDSFTLYARRMKRFIPRFLCPLTASLSLLALFIIDTNYTWTEWNQDSEHQNSTRELIHSRDRHDVFFKRLSLLHYQCALHKNKNEINPPARLFLAKNSTFRFCKVYKSGSTYFSEVLLSLNKEDKLDTPFGIRRNKIHEMTFEILTRESKLSAILEDDVVAMVARDPFPRLYSAYIDKIFLPGYWTMYKTIAKDKTPICKKSNTFALFLDFIARSNRTSLDVHWRPIYDECRPCTVPYNYILKLETLPADVGFMFRQMKLRDHHREELMKGLQENNVMITLKEVIGEMTYYGEKVDKECMSFTDFTKRLWKAFQLQGYISDDVSYPAEQFTGLDYSSNKEILNIVMTGVKQQKLSSKEKREQKRRHMLMAYETVNRKTLRKVIEIFDEDFRLFDYSSIPPYLRN